jgi:hypothetical protein
MMEGFQQAAADQAAAQAPAPQGTFPEGAPTPAPTQAQAITLDDGSIVVNGKVYKAEAAVKKIEHADTHIQQLERENAEKDANAMTLLTRLEALEASRKHTDTLDQVVAAAQAVAPPVVIPEQPPTQAVSKEELVQAAVDTIEGHRVVQQQDANLNASIALAQTAFGDDFGTKIDAAATTFGLEYDAVMAMAKNQPAVFKSLFIPASAATGTPDTTSSTMAGTIGQGVTTTSTSQKSFLKMNSKQRAELIANRMKALSTTG